MSTNSCQCVVSTGGIGTLPSKTPQGPSFSIPNGTDDNGAQCTSMCQAKYPNMSNVSGEYNWQQDASTTQRKAWLALVIFGVIIVAVIVAIVLAVKHFGKKKNVVSIVAPPSGIAGGRHHRYHY